MLSTGALMTISSIPRCFRRDSALGVPGLINAYRTGNVSLANSIGTGVADDKVMYYFVAPHDQILPRPGAADRERADLSGERGKRQLYILENLEKLVVKAANESGG